MRYKAYFLLLGPLVLIGAGCGPSATTTTEGQATAPSAAVKVKADAFAGIPRYPKATETDRKTSEDGKASMLTLSSADDVVTVATWYDDQFKANGWTELTSLNSPFLTERTVTKGNDEMDLSAEINSETEGSTVTITLKKK